MTQTDIQIAICGSAGDGTIAAGGILNQAMARAGYKVIAFDVYPAEIRGFGECIARSRITSQQVYSLKGQLGCAAVAERRPRHRPRARGARLRRRDLRGRADHHPQGGPSHLRPRQGRPAALRRADARAVGEGHRRRQVAQHGGAGLPGRALRHAAGRLPRDHRGQVQDQGQADRHRQHQGLRHRLRRRQRHLPARHHRARRAGRRPMATR